MVDVQKIDRRCADMSPGFCIQREAAVAGAQGKSHIAAGKVDEVAVSAKFDRLDLIIICDPRDRCERAAAEASGFDLGQAASQCAAEAHFPTAGQRKPDRWGDRVTFDARRIEITARRKLRSEEHTSELQSLMRISYAVFCLKKKKKR